MLKCALELPLHQITCSIRVVGICECCEYTIQLTHIRFRLAGINEVFDDLESVLLQISQNNAPNTLFERARER